MHQNKVSIITVSFNRKNDLLDLLDRLKDQKYTNFEIIVVDNASTDGTVEEVRKNSPLVKIIPLQENLGLYAGLNIGIEKARGDLIVIIDHDCVPANKYFLSKIIKKFSQNPNLDVLACCIKNYYTKKIMWDNSAHSKIGNTTLGYKCIFINGSGFCAKRKVFKNYHFDEQFFIYHGDTDFSWKVLEMGLECKYFPDIVVYHKQAARRSSSVFYQKVVLRNTIWLYWKFFPISYLIGSRFGFLNRIAIRLLVTHPLYFFMSIYEAFRGLPQIIRKREPLSRKTLKLLFFSQNKFTNKF